ncbi:hypothetical protein C9374_005463 [Naegleria lovaniensis]|uniref:UBX domain-containing protein n=1 Tax=Naegleria lovaniensis TaxID=51637 RepID=A0AA88GJR5_NAELO|nr:uncharacterized protein C9374_005463 [Naegleria lovaniensis]KAG2382261.1 hypothetical protein C9374_005463 [Naegleria lovaniensis]
MSSSESTSNSSTNPPPPQQQQYSFLFNGTVTQAIQLLTQPLSPLRYLFIFITTHHESTLLHSFNSNSEIVNLLKQPQHICIHIIKPSIDYTNFASIYIRDETQSMDSVYVLNRNGENIYKDLNPNVNDFIQKCNEGISNSDHHYHHHHHHTITSSNPSNPIPHLMNDEYDSDIYGPSESSIESSSITSSTTSITSSTTCNSNHNNTTTPLSSSSTIQLPQYRYDFVQETPEEKKKKIQQAMEKARRRLNRENNSGGSGSGSGTGTGSSGSSGSGGSGGSGDGESSPTTPSSHLPLSPMTPTTPNTYQRVKTELTQQKKEELEYKKKLKEQIKRDRVETTRQQVDQVSNIENSTPMLKNQQSNETGQYVPTKSQTTMIAFKLPNGEVKKQTFQSTQTIKDLHEFKNTNIEGGTKMIMSIMYPRIVLSDQLDTKTLESMNLCPNGVILLSNDSSNNAVEGCEHYHHSSNNGPIGIISGLFTKLIILVITAIQWVGGFIFPSPQQANGRNSTTTPSSTSLDPNNNNNTKRNKSLRDNGNSTQFEYRQDGDDNSDNN